MKTLTIVTFSWLICQNARIPLAALLNDKFVRKENGELSLCQVSYHNDMLTNSYHGYPFFDVTSNTVDVDAMSKDGNTEIYNCTGTIFLTKLDVMLALKEVILIALSQKNISTLRKIV